jgi:hypothetical protein
MAELLLPKQVVRVRFPSLAPMSIRKVLSGRTQVETLAELKTTEMLE